MAPAPILQLQPDRVKPTLTPRHAVAKVRLIPAAALVEQRRNPIKAENSQILQPLVRNQWLMILSFVSLNFAQGQAISAQPSNVTLVEPLQWTACETGTRLTALQSSWI